MLDQGQNPGGENLIAAFASFADKYEKGVGRATRHIARKLVALCPPFSEHSKVLDNACGTGIVIEEIQRQIASTDPTSNAKITVIAADAAKPMIDLLDAKISQVKDKEWPNIGSITTHVVPAEELDEKVAPTGSITHHFMNFGLFLCSDPAKAAAHIYRSLAPGGHAFITSWSDFGYINPARKTEEELKLGALGGNFKMPFSEKWEDPAYLKEVMVNAGFAENKVHTRQEDSSMQAANAREHAVVIAELLTRMVRGDEGWKSEEDKQRWVASMARHLVEDEHCIQNDANGFALKMKANVVICQK